MEGLYFYKLISPYTDDVTKDCKLTINEIDSNFLNLKNADVKDLKFDRESKTLILTTNAGDTYVADLSSVTYDLDVDYDEGVDNPSGATITIKYDGADGEKEIVIDHVLTMDNLNTVLGSEILTRVITDGTLLGDGTLNSPLGLNPIEQTGFYRPAIDVIDTTSGDTLPEVSKLGTRYVTKEYVSEYGKLYNYNAVQEIQAVLDAEGKGWRIPTKDDWDTLLNSIESCNEQNHDDEKCHVDLGKYAGTFLKSECGWTGQEDCVCLDTIPQYNSGTTNCDDDDDDDDPTTPVEKDADYVGVDKYGFNIYPAGMAHKNKHCEMVYEDIKDAAYYWTTTHIHGDENQDAYVKEFVWNKSGVRQVASCPDDYYSIRLVKDYDGTNNLGNEYIDGASYDTSLYAAAGQIWTDLNFSNEGYDSVVDVNGGEGITNQRVQFFINEWNGEYWVRKPLVEGDTIVITNPSSECGVYNIEYRVYSENCDQVLVNPDDASTINVLNNVLPELEEEAKIRKEADDTLSGLIETLKEEHTTEVDAINDLINALKEQHEEDVRSLSGAIESSQDQSDDKTEEEKKAREEAVAALSGAIDSLIEDMEIADEAIGVINDEIASLSEADKKLEEEILNEESAREEADNALSGAIATEVERATNKESEIEGHLIDSEKDYTIVANPVDDEPNLTLYSKDGEHNIVISADWNFGEF